MENSEYIELVKLAKDGDSVAFENLVEQHYLLVYKISYNWCKQKKMLKILRKRFFVKLAKNIFNFKEESAFQTWLYRIVINTAKDYTKKQGKKTCEGDEVQRRTTNNVWIISTRNLNGRQIHQMIECLPQKLKDTALLVFMEGMTHKEAAVVLDCAEKTISWRIHQVKKELKKRLNRGETI